MISIHQAIKQIIKASQTKLYYNDFGFTSMPPKLKLPLFGYRLLKLKEVLTPNGLLVDYTLRMGIWEKYPKHCKSMDEVLKATEQETQQLKSKLKAIVLILEKYYDFERITGTQGTIEYKIKRNFIGDTAHRLYSVFVDVTLRRCEAENCCLEIEFDLDKLEIEKPIKTNSNTNWLGQKI